jgi:hypothetical protein
LRDDHRHRLADIAYAAEGEDGMVRLLDLLAVFSRVSNDVGQRFEAGIARVLAREHRRHSGVRQCPGGIEFKDFSVRPIRAQKNRMKLTRKIPIGGVATLAGDETKILAARHGT